MILFLNIYGRLLETGINASFRVRARLHMFAFENAITVFFFFLFLVFHKELGLHQNPQTILRFF